MERLRIEVIDWGYAAILAAKSPAERAWMINDCHRTARVVLAAGKEPATRIGPKSRWHAQCPRGSSSEQVALIRLVVQSLDALAIPDALVGTGGSGIDGEPRFTRDVRIVRDRSAARASPFCEAVVQTELARCNRYLNSE